MIGCKIDSSWSINNHTIYIMSSNYNNNDYILKITQWNNIIKKTGHNKELINELYYEGDERHGNGFIKYLSYINNNRDRDRDRD